MPIQINDVNVIDDGRNFYAAGIATVGSGSSATVIDGNTGTVNVGVGITLEGSPGNISIAGTINAAGFNVPTNPISFDPTNNETDVSTLKKITITFDQVVGVATVGSMTLRSGSISGSVIQTIPYSSITRVSNRSIRIESSVLPTNTQIFPVIPKDFIVATGGFNGINTSVGTYSFTTGINTAQTFTPSSGATSVSTDTNITISFTSAPVRGTGTITLRTGSASGTIIESFDAASSNRISISGNNWILDPTNTLNISTTYYLVIPSGAIDKYDGTSSYSFTTGSLGNAYEGGYLICQSGGIRWIVAPAAAEVSRPFNSSDSNLLAQQISGCTGWFVPNKLQLQNPGFACRTYWDSYSLATYWSSDNAPNVSPFNRACGVSMINGSAGTIERSTNLCVRSFRTVSY